MLQKQYVIVVLVFFAWLVAAGAQAAGTMRTVIDASGRKVVVPGPVRHVICSGPGALRLMTYLQGQNLVVAVDDIEASRQRFDARPYALANPLYKQLPIFGEFRGFDNPELILSLKTPPQVIFKTHATMGHDPQELQEKTGIPTVILKYGNLGPQRDDLSQSLRIMGDIIGKSLRAEKVIAFFEAAIADLEQRTATIPPSQKRTCYVGSIAYKGPHGLRSTETGYPPFMFVNAANVAGKPTPQGKSTRQVIIAREQLLVWNPDVLFLDLTTLKLQGAASGIWEIRNDPAFKTLNAVQQGRVYGVLPYNWYTQNFGSILADAYFIGKTLYPDYFQDIDPVAKADDIYAYLVGAPVFNAMNASFGNMVFKAVKE